MYRPAARRRPLLILAPATALALALLALVLALGPLRGQLPERRSGPRAGGTGPLEARHLALVINAADPVSEAIGRHYIRARRLPPRQVIRVRFTPGRSTLSAWEFRRIHDQVRRRTPSEVQAYALAWTAPWRVECVSITSAFAFGRIRSSCFNTCGATPLSPYHAREDVQRPWSELGMRPTMLLAATSAAAGRALIDRGVAADGTAPPGTAYLLSGTDPIRNVRAAGYASLVKAMAPGFRVRVLWADALRDAADVMLLVVGAVSVPDLTSNRFRPGAVADHLTSSGGVLSGHSGQMSALRWLEAGATGSYGTVVEPCNLTAKFPDPGLVLAFYRRGDTLIESYWRSVAMPEQGVFIGEPLARPWPAAAALR